MCIGTVTIIKGDFNPRSREGSDCFDCLTSFCHNDFNPRSREGSDSSALDPQDTLLLFQSTLPRRERRILYKFRLQRDQISIHAPAKGATRTWETSSLAWQFQSTLPRRERHPCGCIGYFNCNNFNPRSREGSDFHSELPLR